MSDMGIRIHKACGYGMTIKQFQSIIGPDVEAYDYLEKTFPNNISLSKKDWEEWDKHKYGYIFSKEISVSKLHPLSKFWFTVSDCDNIHAIGFVPSNKDYKDWYRFDNSLDHQEYFNTHKRNGIDPTMETDIYWQEFGLYPFLDYYDPEKNERVREGIDRTVHPWKIKDGLIPTIPTEIRFALTKYAKWNDRQINMLRPFTATWWC